MRVIADLWREQGARIEVQRGPDRCDKADLVVNHVDLTVTPSEYVECLREAPRTINGRVTDISKRLVSQSLVHRADGYDGPVIIKTNRNFGGKKEAGWARESSRSGRVREWIRNRLPWTCRTHMSVDAYRVLDSVRQVPWLVWRNPHLVVERFMPERREGLYCLRTWTFLGDQETNSLSYATTPVIKSASVVRREVVPEVPPELRAHRARLGFDFGKFDYVMHEGRAVLFDANRTPAIGSFPPEQYLPRMRTLAAGLPSVLGSGAAR